MTVSDNEYIRWTNYEKINKGSCLPFSENLFLAGRDLHQYKVDSHTINLYIKIVHI